MLYLTYGELTQLQFKNISFFKIVVPYLWGIDFTGYNGRADKKSTGIGLYMCKKIMERLNHQIWIESEVDKGTKVYLALAREEWTIE